MWHSRILFALADLYSDPSSVLGVLAVSRSLSVAVPSEDTLAPVSPWRCGEVAGVKPELRAWLRALTCPLRLASRTPTVPHLTCCETSPGPRTAWENTEGRRQGL